MNPLIKVAKALGGFTATPHGRDVLKGMGFGPGSQFVCCERTDTIVSLSERSRSAEPPAVWAYLDANEKLEIVVVSPLDDRMDDGDVSATDPQEYGPETTVEMLVHVSRATGEKCFKPSRWDLPRRAAVLEDAELVSA